MKHTKYTMKYNTVCSRNHFIIESVSGAAYAPWELIIRFNMNPKSRVFNVTNYADPKYYRDNINTHDGMP